MAKKKDPDASLSDKQREKIIQQGFTTIYSTIALIARHMEELPEERAMLYALIADTSHPPLEGQDGDDTTGKNIGLGAPLMLVGLAHHLLHKVTAKSDWEDKATNFTQNLIEQLRGSHDE